MASALQVHGGIGFTWEHDLHFFLKRAQLDQLAFGDASAHRARLAVVAAAAGGSGGECRLTGRVERQPPDDVEWNEWGPPVRVRVEHAPGRAVRPRGQGHERRSTDPSRPRARPGFERVPVPPTFTFVMSDSGAFPDLQPAGGTGSMYAASGATPGRRSRATACYLHGEQHFTYHRQVSVGDVLEGRMRTSKPVARDRAARTDGSHLVPDPLDRRRRDARRRRADRLALLPERLSTSADGSSVGRRRPCRDLVPVRRPRTTCRGCPGRSCRRPWRRPRSV